ncbi:MAG: outer membrane protein assembly factor BamD [Bacteroidetes bacterium]|nr:outer membrane protein assembly factor BamD [Bacteroidota bacterium]MCY4205760.1 outer membrane protein assembly factor BamD [Bacteroidota bacterium]
MQRKTIILFLLIAGCSGSGRLNYDSPSEAYEKGMSYFEDGRYIRASQYFQGVFDFGRTHEWAAEAQLYLARSHYMNRDYILAASEYTRFSQLYRADARVPDAEFERAMTFYKRSPQIELDQTNTRRGVEVFNLYIQRYSDHDSIEVAVQRVGELRRKLADKQFHAGKLYERRGLYQAAALSYEVVFDKFPDTPLADDALLGATRCYIEYSAQSIAARQPERLQKAITHYQRLLDLFPDSELIDEARELGTQAERELDELLSSNSTL